MVRYNASPEKNIRKRMEVNPMNLERYEEPKMEIVEFENEDVITTSTPFNGEQVPFDGQE